MQGCESWDGPTFPSFFDLLEYCVSVAVSLRKTHQYLEFDGAKWKELVDIHGRAPVYFIGIRVPVFQKRAKRRLAGHPKYYFFDAGVYRAVRPRGPLDAPEQIDGAALETLVFQELRATSQNLGMDYDLYYWRTAGGMEVDFVLYGPRGIVALEVERKRRLSGHDLRGLRAFLEDYPMAKAYVLYGGDHAAHFGPIHALPIAQALRDLPQLL